MSGDWVERRIAATASMNDPARPDNMSVRLALVERMGSGEITLEEAQAQLAALKRKRA